MTDTIFSIAALREAYRSGHATITDMLELAAERAEKEQHRHVWITRLGRAEIQAYAERLRDVRPDQLPLYGVPFAIKDNIDLAGVPTSAACRAFSYTPARSARAVQKLLDAGAIPLGKTNMDQFATGLAGTRSPDGICANSINGAYIAGGSSSGSAVAVALGLASFALGTDTAGSGRVPAAFNNIAGLKPSNGRISTRGVVPANRSLDCVAIFARTSADLGLILDVAAGFDPEDAYSREVADVPLRALRYGVPRESQLEFFGDEEYARLYREALARIDKLGGARVEIDFSPFADAARLLYGGAFIGERFAALGRFIEEHPQEVHPVTRQVILRGKALSAADAFAAEHARMALKRRSESAWAQVDLIVTPTAGTIYPLEKIAADPLQLPATLGYYTVFMNFFQLAGVAVPAGFRPDGLPFGITLVGPDGTERALLRIAGSL